MWPWSSSCTWLHLVRLLWRFYKSASVKYSGWCLVQSKLSNCNLEIIVILVFNSQLFTRQLEKKEKIISFTDPQICSLLRIILNFHLVFLFSPKNSFNFSCGMDLLATNYLHFCLSEIFFHLYWDIVNKILTYLSCVYCSNLVYVYIVKGFLPSS